MIENKYIYIFLIGGLTFCLLHVLSQQRDNKYVSMLVAFPLLFIIGLWFLHYNKNLNIIQYVHSTCITIGIYLVFLLILYYLLGRQIDIMKSLIYSILFWFLLNYVILGY